jgi:NAD(P)H-dependent FMN reductase
VEPGNPLYLPVLYGSVREGRKSFGVATWICARLSRRPGVSTQLFDPKKLPFGNLTRRADEMDPVPEAIAAFRTEIGRADGFVIVTPEYNFGIPGALKNMFDPFEAEWRFKPFGIVTAGGLSGGLRAADQLRIGIPGLGGISVPLTLPVHRVEAAWNETGPTTELAQSEKRADSFFLQVEWYARALRAARAQGLPIPKK